MGTFSPQFPGVFTDALAPSCPPPSFLDIFCPKTQRQLLSNRLTITQMCSIVKEGWGIRGMRTCHYFMTQRLQPEIAKSLGGAPLRSHSADLALVSKGLCRVTPSHGSFESTKLSCLVSLDEQGIMFWVLLTVFSIKTGLHCALWLKFKQHIIRVLFTLYNDIFFLPWIA